MEANDRVSQAFLPFENQNNQTLNLSNNASSVQNDFNDTSLRFLFYDGLRCLQMFIGIIGNAATLKVIFNLKVLRNGHILMAYLAVSDILVCSMVPLSTFTAISRTLPDHKNYWKTVCLFKEYFYITASSFSVLCHMILSIDR